MSSTTSPSTARAEMRSGGVRARAASNGAVIFGDVPSGSVVAGAIASARAK